jgi:anion-transporting  ArsA/GET3 family ATPase
VVGGDAIADAIAFFRAFDGMEEGFRARASAVDQLLTSDDTAYVLVTAPRRDTVDEARFFARRLAERGSAPAALIVNRRHPRFPTTPARRPTPALVELHANAEELNAVADGEARVLAPLVDELRTTPTATVPLLATDVHDLDGLAEIGSHLFGGRRPDR